MRPRETRGYAQQCNQHDGNLHGAVCACVLDMCRFNECLAAGYGSSDFDGIFSANRTYQRDCGSDLTGGDLANQVPIPNLPQPRNRDFFAGSPALWGGADRGLCISSIWRPRVPELSTIPERRGAVYLADDWFTSDRAFASCRQR